MHYFTDLQKVRQVVDQLYSRYKTNCPMQLASHLGIEVVDLDLTSSWESKFMNYLDKTIIAVKKCVEDTKKKYLVAHELGHILLHADNALCFYDYFSPDNIEKYDQEADYFAQYFLSNQFMVAEGTDSYMVVDEVSL